MGKKAGLELEVWPVSNDWRRSLNVKDLLPALNTEAMTRHGTYVPEAAPDALELVGNPAASIGEATRSIIALYRNALSHCQMHCTMRSPVPRSRRILDKPVGEDRIGALWQAIEEEGVELGYRPLHRQRINLMRDYAATHVTYSYDHLYVGADRVDDEAAAVASVLGALGMQISRVLCRSYGVDNSSHGGIWYGWANPSRISPYGAWFPSGGALVEHFESLPRLISNGGGTGKRDSGWRVDRQTNLSWKRKPDHASGYWPICRMKPFIGGNGGFELRILPSMTPLILGPLMQDLDRFVDHIVEHSSKVVGIPTLADFMRSGAWETIRSCPVTDGVYLPREYPCRAWWRDVFC